MLITTRQRDEMIEIIKEMYLEISKDYKNALDSGEFQFEFDHHFRDGVTLYVNQLEPKYIDKVDSGPKYEFLKNIKVFNTEQQYKYLTSVRASNLLMESFFKLGIPNIDYKNFKDVFLYVLAVYDKIYRSEPKSGLIDMSILVYDGSKCERFEYYKKFTHICTMFYLTTIKFKPVNINNIDDDSDYRIKKLFGVYISAVLANFIKLGIAINLDKSSSERDIVTFNIDTIKGDLSFDLSFQDKEEDKRIKHILMSMAHKQIELVEKGITNTLIGFDTNVRDFLLNDNERALTIKYSKKKHGIEAIFNHSNGAVYYLIPSNLIKAYSEKENTFTSALPLTTVELKDGSKIGLPCTVYELALAD